MADDARRQAEELDFWDGSVTALPHPIGDGWFLVDDGDKQYAVHMADDRPDYAVFRYNEIAVS